MRFLLSTLAVIAALVLIAVSGSMNYLFMQSMAKTQTEGYVLGAASVAVDIFKALLPVLIWWALKDRRYAFMVPAIAMFSVFSAFLLTSAIGFAASNRGHVSELREGANAELAAVTSEIASQSAKLKTLPRHRPAAVVEQALAAKRQHRRWTSTKGCANGKVTANKSRAFCKDYFILKAELEAAVTAAYVERRIADLRRTEKRLRDRGAGGQSDPQVSILAKLSGNDESAVRTALVLFVALLLELGSGLGLWIATGHSEIFGRKNKTALQPQPVAPPGATRPSRDLTIAHQPDHIAPEASAITQHSPSPPPKQPQEPGTDQPQARARAVAQIEDYLLQRIRPAAEGGVTLATLYDDYLAWSAQRRSEAASQGFFGMVIEKAMQEVGIPHDGRHYVGIRLAPSTSVAA